MNKNLSFYKSITTPTKAQTSDKSWDIVMDSYKQKQYKDVVLGIIDYVDPTLASKTGNANRSEFVIPHGSAELHLQISDDEFSVKAPFLNVANAKKIPLLRKVTELNFSPINLSSIKLNGDDLVFEFSAPLELCEPYKIYDVLREICIYADSYDDEFITKFDAKWIHQPQIEAYSESERQQAWDNMHVLIQEALAAVSEFENKRNFNFAWDVLAITLMKLEYYIQPQGMLRTDIEKIISYLLGSRDSINEKLNRGRNFLNKLAGMDRNDFDKDLYQIQTFIPYKMRSNVQAVKNNSENAYAQAKKEMEQGNHLAASLTLTYQFFYLLYHNHVPTQVLKNIENGLEQTSGKDFKTTAEKLMSTLEAVMQGKDAPSPEKKKGLFSRLFG